MMPRVAFDERAADDFHHAAQIDDNGLAVFDHLVHVGFLPSASTGLIDGCKIILPGCLQQPGRQAPIC